MSKVITIGEALVEIMRSSAGQPLDITGEFHGPFASGAPAIFAVAAARLGLPTVFIGAIGDDAFGRFLEERLAAETVAYNIHLALPPELHSSLMMTMVNVSSSSIFATLHPGNYQPA